MAHSRAMNSVILHSAHREVAKPASVVIPFRTASKAVPRGPVPAGHRAKSADAALRLSTTPLSDPAEILRRMPAQAISPALLELLDVMSSPVLLIECSPAGELREMAPAAPARGLRAA